MNVWHIIDSEGLYGAELMLLQLAEEQLKTGINATIVSIGNHNVAEKAIEKQAVDRNIPLKVYRMSNGPNFFGAYKIIKESQEANVNILHSHGYKGNILFGLMPRFIRKIPIISTLHGWIVSKPFSRMAVYVWLDKISIRRMDYVITVNQLMQNFLSVRMRNKGKVVTIENGIRSQAVTNSKYKQNLLPKGFLLAKYTIGSVGRLSVEKGFKDLIVALGLLRKDGIDARLIIIGEGTERKNLEVEAKQQRVEEYVALPGYQSSIGQYLSMYDVMVLPSLTEGLPLTMLEAMRAKIPVIATDVGGMPTVIEHGVGGVIVKKQSPTEIAVAVGDLLENRELARSYADYSYQKFCENYTVETMGQKYNQVYDVLILKQEDNNE